MLKINSSTKVTLPHTYGLEATIILSRAGQEDRCKGDGVVVRAQIRLPKETSTEHLHHDLQFRTRVSVADEQLYPLWGQDGTEFRQITKAFVAPNWSKAFADAHDWAWFQINYLVQALEARAEAMANAEADIF